MSRIIKKELSVADGTIFSQSGNLFVVSGKLGNVSINLNGLVSIDSDSGLKFNSLEQQDTGMLGTAYVLVKNAMRDVLDGCEVTLKMVGVGFKASVIGRFLRVYVGLSHDVFFAIPDGVNVVISNDVEINIKGYNRCDVMQFAMAIRSIKKPEPYKGKGIFVNGEKVLRKEGKKK